MGKYFNDVAEEIRVFRKIKLGIKENKLCKQS